MSVHCGLYVFLCVSVCTHMNACACISKHGNVGYEKNIEYENKKYEKYRTLQIESENI